MDIRVGEHELQGFCNLDLTVAPSKKHEGLAAATLSRQRVLC